MKATKTIHIRQDVHRILKQMAAYEEQPLEDVTDRVLRFALNLPSDTTQAQQQELGLTRAPVPEALRHSEGPQYPPRRPSDRSAAGRRRT